MPVESNNALATQVAEPVVGASAGPSPAKRAAPIPKPLRAQAEQVMLGNYAFMDSPSFEQPEIEKDLFSEDEPVLPLVAWYQPDT